MGTVPNIDFDHFPQQGSFKGRHVRVCFNYDSSRSIGGTVIRDDNEDPGLMIIQLTDGRVVLSTECMYSLELENLS